ncbi:uncharacterized protein TOT_020000017 [Theileria orientalis strain Shintoku]|uniref:Replication protein A C-terminal domain-containing protein n=1 Tax=Theileria orientalis strain Shintoku TaxID=869250 RepID=J4DNY0_THEOR|nr:uncharacterized protein TOT_020000017 [Theileria orientalis strain Shintoku]PVC50566.1 hypothetical protein MACL_00002184 [Theileria orientalis]BAM39744.1 uncharacterized protein TOT_020000017 [Theileria orientalis strain Shintoku]|eukprot:XP_009690045.1 uncharacterized protein TOT_020000017 [Theileria orientalis strain Shintoku]
MFGGVNQDSFGANWGISDLNQVDNNDGGFFEEDLSNYLNEDAGNKQVHEVAQRKTFMPLKINMIYSSWKTGGSSINILGYQLDIIKLVGRIVDAKTTEQDTTFVIDDGTGSIDCIHLFPGDMTEWKTNYVNNLMKTKSQVKVYGGFNPLYSSSNPTIIIYSIKELSSPEESKLHDLDVIYSILSNDGKSNPKVNDTLTDMDSVLKQFKIVKTDRAQEMPEKAPVPAQVNTTAATTKIPANELALTKFISSMLSNEARNNNFNGLHVSEILKRCNKQHSFQSVQEQHVRKVLSDLERDASVYQTLDSNTYASTDS